ncbi:hypothetical protein [Bradyrhizobium sp. HKCCYLS20291]|uniref:hypothetical protein n=1 Tax=Bradyrhizobium sp. HKCCYLS20291 TaxID=3420766 RepID=UPI003EBAD82E
MATESEETIVIARMIESYLERHPRAADTPEGIRDWWLAVEQREASLPAVLAAAEYLVALKRLARIVLIDGTVVYACAQSGGGAS